MGGLKRRKDYISFFNRIKSATPLAQNFISICSLSFCMKTIYNNEILLFVHIKNVKTYLFRRCTNTRNGCTWLSFGQVKDV